jgi:hypothetical protein
LFEVAGQLFGGGFEGIEASPDFGGGVVPLEQLAQAGLAPAGGPPGTEPLRMRKAQVRLFFLQPGQGLLKLGTVPQ